MPTSKDIPPVTLTNIPHVDSSEFAPYLAQVGALYEQLQNVKENREEAPAHRRRSSRHEQPELGGDGHLRPGSRHQMGRKGSIASLSSVTSVDVHGPARRASSGLIRKAAQGPAPLSTIPNVYFEENFHLENPRTFDVVSERSEVIPLNEASQNNSEDDRSVHAPRKALATNAILQEKLSWYMDTIEVHLINAISTASTTFFTALSSLKDLHSETADSVQRIQVLRDELQVLDDEIATNGLQISRKRRRQENLRQLGNAVLQLRQIVDGVARCESLIDAGEIDKALASVDSLEKLISGEREQPNNGMEQLPLRDLRPASALRGIDADLNTLRFQVGRAFESQFSGLLIADLHRHVDSVSCKDVLQRWGNAASRAKGGHSRTPSFFPAYLVGTEELRAQLFPNMVGLQRARHVSNAVVAYRDAVLREIRNLIRRPLPSSNDDDNESTMSVSTTSSSQHRSSQEKSSILARNLRALDAEDAEALMIKIYVGVTETLRRLTTQTKVLLDIVSGLADVRQENGEKPSSALSPATSPRPDRRATSPLPEGLELQEQLHRSFDLVSLLTQAVDVATDKIVKILKVRSEQVKSLPLDLFLRYFTLNLYFSNECEAISGRSGRSLKTVVNGHIRDFVQKNRDAEMQKLAQAMESDQWNAKDFSDENSILLGHVLECSTKDVAVWTDSAQIWIPYHELEKGKEGQEVSPSEPNGTLKEKVRPAVIDSETFVLPNSAIFCMEGMGNFLHLISGMPSMASEVGSSVVAYLQLFNSRCTQLILGAGATRSAGLKKITTKHLALASQALSFVASLTPHVREFVRRHAGSGAGVSSLMGEFDKVRRQLQEHQSSIHQKLVEIMSDRAATHSKKMKTTDWSLASGEGPRAYMETLVKETAMLHRALTKHLPENATKAIMAQVFTSYREQLGNALNEADPKTAEGWER